MSAIADLINRHDQQLERTLLACVFANPASLDEPWTAIPDELFYLESHRQVWREIRTQWRADGGFDFASIDAAFRAKGQTDIISQVLLPCLAVFEGYYHPTSAYAHVYARQLRQLYVAREKARATLAYQAAIARGDDQAEARLLLDAMLTALDAGELHAGERSAEELADQIGTGSRCLTGIRDLDDLTGGMAKPGLTILAARPSVGKSALARVIVRNLAARGERVFFYSQDQAENQVLELEIARYLRTDSASVRQLEREQIIAAIKAVRSNIWHDRVQLIDTPLALGQLVAAIGSSMAGLVVIDYVQLVNTGHDSEYESITAASKALKGLALSLRVPVLAIAQLNRQQTSAPSLVQLRGSGQLEQDADQVWVLERDTTVASTEEQEAVLYVLKNKVGPTGRVTLHWRARYASYEAASRRGPG